MKVFDRRDLESSRLVGSGCRLDGTSCHCQPMKVDWMVLPIFGFYSVNISYTISGCCLLGRQATSEQGVVSSLAEASFRTRLAKTCACAFNLRSEWSR